MSGSTVHNKNHLHHFLQFLKVSHHLINHQVTHTPVIDTGYDHVHIKDKKIVLLEGTSDEAVYTMLGLIDKAILTTAQEQAEVYLPRMVHDRNILIGAFWGNVLRNYFFAYPSVTLDLFNPKNFRVSRGWPVPYIFAPVLQKRSPYTEHVSLACMRMQEAGLITYLNNFHAIKNGLYRASEKEMTYDPETRAREERPPMLPLTLEGHLGGAFIILLVGLGLGCAAFAHEVISGRKKLALDDEQNLEISHINT